MLHSQALKILASVRGVRPGGTFDNTGKLVGNRISSLKLILSNDRHLASVLEAEGSGWRGTYSAARAKEMLKEALERLAVDGGRADEGRQLTFEELEAEFEFFQEGKHSRDFLAEAEQKLAPLLAIVDGARIRREAQARQFADLLEGQAHCRALLAKADRALIECAAQKVQAEEEIAAATAALPEAKAAVAELRAAVEAEEESERTAEREAKAAEAKKARLAAAEAERTRTEAMHNGADQSEEKQLEERQLEADLRAKGRTALGHTAGGGLLYGTALALSESPAEPEPPPPAADAPDPEEDRPKGRRI